MDITDDSWNFFSNYSLLVIFDKDYYEGYGALQTYVALISIFAPFPITKTIDWILSAKEK